MSTSAFDNSVFANTYVTTGATDSTINGDVLAGTYLTTGATADINGSTVAGTATTTGADANVSGDVHSGTATTLGASAVVDGNVDTGTTVTYGAGATAGSEIASGVTPTVTVEQAEVLAAQSYLSSLTPDHIVAPGNDATGRTYQAGVHQVTGLLTFTADTTITLDAVGDLNAEFIFNVSNYLTFGAGVDVVIINGGPNVRVIWNAHGGYISVGARANIVGTLMAHTYVSTGADSDVSGVDDTCGGAVYSATSYVSIGAGATVGAGIGCTPNTPPVDPPLECTAVVVDEAKALITWSSVVGADRYVVYRNGYWLFASNTALSYTDANPPTGITVEYEVRTVSDGDKGDFVLCATALEFDAPPAPAPCTLEVVEGAIVQLNWSSLAGATQYAVSRSGVFLGRTTLTSHIDSTPPADTLLKYWVASITEGTRDPWVKCGSVTLTSMP
ncbi:MAG: hypothetical protein ACI9C1_000478 [Candidatus Aldehydirespiratoraceae bacterium]|jgi:hypothetical protein